MPEDADFRREDRLPGSPEIMATLTKELADAGAKFIGGCCGTTPAHVRAVKNRLRTCIPNPDGI